MLELHIGGPIILTKVVEGMSGYDKSDPDKVSKCQDHAFDQFLGYLYLDNADKSKYGSILQGLNTQQSLGNDQYPKTITESNNVLSNHKFDNTKSDSHGRSNQGRDKDKDKDKDKSTNEEKDEKDITLSFAQMEGKCYCCGKPGHKSPTCRDKNKPKEE